MHKLNLDDISLFSQEPPVIPMPSIIPASQMKNPGMNRKKSDSTTWVFCWYSIGNIVVFFLLKFKHNSRLVGYRKGTWRRTNSHFANLQGRKGFINLNCFADFFPWVDSGSHILPIGLVVLFRESENWFEFRFVTLHHLCQIDQGFRNWCQSICISNADWFKLCRQIIEPQGQLHIFMYMSRANSGRVAWGAGPKIRFDAG